MHDPSIKVFNTTGPCIPEEHYMLPVLPRIPDIDGLIEGKYYFIIHAPRQSGKTTYLQILTNKINSEGKMYAFYCSLDLLQNIQNIDIAMSTIHSQIINTLASSGVLSFKNFTDQYVEQPNSSFDIKILNILRDLSRFLDKDVVVFFDEADCIAGKPLIPFLRQIRLGYNNRHISLETKFPRSLALVGMRDIRDYIVNSRSGDLSIGSASPFNIKKEDLTLTNFTQDEIGALYYQHTEASGQIFEPQAIERAYYWTDGQPWLVNALAFGVIDKILKNDYSVAINNSLIDQAANALMLRRETHIDSILQRLKDPRVRRVLEPVITGEDNWSNEVEEEDIQYVQDLGLLKLDQKECHPANPIYASVIIRTLTNRMERDMPKYPFSRWIKGKKLLISQLLKEFQKFWRIKADQLTLPFGYRESHAQVIMLAFMQTLLNSGIQLLLPEYGLGRRRIDIMIEHNGVRYPIELKVISKKQSKLSKIKIGTKQLKDYMDTCAAKEGWLVIFDRESKKPWKEKLTWETIEYEGLIIHVVGC
jgi:hypothetical protein